MTTINPPIARGEAASIVRHTFGADVDLLGIVPLGGGQVNSTGMVILGTGERLVLRIAPDPIQAGLAPSWLSPSGLRREAAVIEAAGPDLARLLPVTVAHDFGGSVIPRDWVLQRVMPGVPLDTLLPSLDNETSERIWQEVGRFMRELHDRGQPPFGPLTEGEQFKSWFDLVRHDLLGLHHDFTRFDLTPAPMERLQAAIDRHADILAGVPAALIHSDLNPAHLFITDDDDDGSLHLGGLIDLEYGRIADPLSEHLLATAVTTRDTSESARAILHGYGAFPIAAGVDERIQIAAALGAAWDATLLAYQQRDPAPALERLEQGLADLAID